VPLHIDHPFTSSHIHQISDCQDKHSIFISNSCTIDGSNPFASIAASPITITTFSLSLFPSPITYHTPLFLPSSFPQHHLPHFPSSYFSSLPLSMIMHQKPQKEKEKGKKGHTKDLLVNLKCFYKVSVRSLFILAIREETLRSIVRSPISTMSPPWMSGLTLLVTLSFLP